MRFILSLLLIITLMALSLNPVMAMKVDLFLAPDGGFSPDNNQRQITFKDGTKVKATLNNGLLDMVDRVPAGGAIKIVMYNFNFPPLLKMLLTKAMNENVQVKVLLDGCAGWTKDNVADFAASVKSAAKNAEKEKKPFDFQVKVTTQAVMSKMKRTKIIDEDTPNAKEIFGSMHEKFGIMYDKKEGEPTHSFAGSSNISESADQKFAENRIFFRDAPVVSKVWHNQFARLWNLYSELRAGTPTEEKLYELPEKLPFEIIFNGEHIGEFRTPEELDEITKTKKPEVEKLIAEVGKTGKVADDHPLREFIGVSYSGELYFKKPANKFRKIDDRIIELMSEVKPEGSVDIAMFSFTHWNIGNKIVELAQKNPKATFRLFFDQSMIEVNEFRRGLMAPYIEEKIKELNLTNIDIRYKFRANAFGYDKEIKAVGLVHFRSPLLHDKLMIVNKEKIIFGSYNWSASAEERNFEDVMVFDAATDYGKEVITRFLSEYNWLWEKSFDHMTKDTTYTPYCISGPKGRELKGKIIKVLSDFIPSKVRGYLDEGDKTYKEMLKKGKFTRDALTKAITDLESVGLIKKITVDNVEKYTLAD